MADQTVIEGAAAAHYENYYANLIGRSEHHWKFVPPERKRQLISAMCAAIEAMADYFEAKPGASWAATAHDIRAALQEQS